MRNPRVMQPKSGFPNHILGSNELLVVIVPVRTGPDAMCGVPIRVMCDPGCFVEIDSIIYLIRPSLKVELTRANAVTGVGITSFEEDDWCHFT